MGVSTKEIDRTVWVIVKASEYCYSEDDKEIKKRINICFDKTSAKSALECEIYRTLSILSDISSKYVRDFIEKHTNSSIHDDDGGNFFTQAFLKGYLQLVLDLTSYNCDTYEFIYYITTFVNQFYDNISYHYLTELYGSNTNNDDKIRFSAYYCAYVYIRKSSVYNELLEKRFEKLCEESYDYNSKLVDEIKANYHKIKGERSESIPELNQSIYLAKKLMDNPNFKTNPAVIATYCDCVIWKLERIASTGSCMSDEDKTYLSTALSEIRKSIVIVPDYATYYILYGRLLYLQGILCNPENIETSVINLTDAKDAFRKAGRLLERSSYDYLPRSRMIAGLDAKCDIKIERLHAAADATVSSERVVQGLERKMSFRMLELLGFFTAIIALILTAVQNITSTQSVVTAMNASVAKEVLPVICQNTIVLTLVLGAVLVVVFGLLILFVKSEQSNAYNHGYWFIIFILIFIAFIGIAVTGYLILQV